MQLKSTKRGDTIIEVMFALAVFSLVAVLSIMSMDRSLSVAEDALEQAATRNELDAQAEAIRFVHNSYIAEAALPRNEADAGAGNRYQQYADLWETIRANVIAPEEASRSGLINLADFVVGRDSATGATGCARVYTSNNHPLKTAKAFVLNTRNLSSRDAAGQTNVSTSYIGVINASDTAKFRESPLNARLVYTTPSLAGSELTDAGGVSTTLSAAEGLWVFAVHDGSSPTATKYFDFYIQSCWYAPGADVPTTIDTVIRLFNPENS